MHSERPSQLRNGVISARSACSALPAGGVRWLRVAAAHALVVIEELAKECRPAAFQVFEANTGPAQVSRVLGTESAGSGFCPPIIRGDATMAIAISEPDAGSAATDMTTRAKYAGGTYT